MAGRSNMRPQTPGGVGELVQAVDLLGSTGLRIRLNPGGGEYEATLQGVGFQPGHPSLVRIRHTRAGMQSTINVIPASTQVRILE